MTDLSDSFSTKDNSLPGEFPYTRGIHPSMYRSRPWTMRQYSGFGDAKATNERFKYLLANGQTGLSVAFDLPTQMGLDSDNVKAKGEVGKTGVAIDSLYDMEVLFKGIDLGKVSTSMTINATASILLCMYQAIAEKGNVSKSDLRGTIQNDILKEYEARNTYIYPPKASMRIVCDIFKYCANELTNFNTISISGYHIREAGATAVQELAFTFANAIEYVQAALKSGLAIDDFAPRLSFFFVAQINFLEEIAKFRAARRIWAKIMQSKFKAKDPKSLTLRFHVQTAGSSLTPMQIDNNITRTTLEAMASVLGGCQSLHTNSKDEALSLPTESSALLALRTQQLILHETGIASTCDPFGGSYYIENLTDEIEADVFELMEEIDKRGGAIASIEDGFIQRQIQDSAYKDHLNLSNNEKIIVGYNKFTDSVDAGDRQTLLKVNNDIEIRQIKALKQLRLNRDNQTVKNTLKALKEISTTNENLLPYILDAVKAYATVGEISDALAQSFGRYQAYQSF